MNSIRDLVEVLSRLQDLGKQIIIVSSGAIAAGASKIGLSRSGLPVGLQQVAAAVGQGLLMEHYNVFLGRAGKISAQVLLVEEDFRDETRFSNLVNTFEGLLERKVIPIVNENDVVTTSELDFSRGRKNGAAFGDNDVLSALVASAIKADILVLLSDVDGLLDSHGQTVPLVCEADSRLEALDLRTSQGRGGLSSKLKAAQKATSFGTTVVWCKGNAETLEALFKGTQVGTIFTASAEARKTASERAFEVAQKAKQAAGALASVSPEGRNRALERLAKAVAENQEAIIAANAEDMEAARKRGISDTLSRRLCLTAEKLDALCAMLNRVAKMPEGQKVLWEKTTGNGLHIRKVRVPLGVICLIFEARPDVVVEAAALCIKTGNALVLKGSSVAARTDERLVSVLRKAITESGLPKNALQLFEGPREDAYHLLRQKDGIDLVIPRGSEDLMNFVRENSLVPVLSAGGGNCHIYVHKDADERMAQEVVVNAKTQNPTVCNAAEKLLVHEGIAASFLPKAAAILRAKGVRLKCDQKSRAILGAFDVEEARESDWPAEFLDLVLAIKVIGSLDDAIAHINRFGTKHSEAIVCTDKKAAEKFMGKVDAAAVYWNASTRFTDGGQFGFGAELGISTQKLHARGPLGADALYSYKYEVEGEGQIRR